MNEYICWHPKIFRSMNSLADEMYWSFTCEMDTRDGYYWTNWPASLACVREKLVHLVDLVDESPYGDHIRGQWNDLLNAFDIATKKKGSFEKFYTSFYALGKYFANVMHRVEKLGEGGDFIR